jgi:branched-chain amino acid transport system ATP-binding protein
MLQVTDIDASYGKKQVLTGVSIDIDHGETVAIIGRNGAGKTTLIRSILGTEGVDVDGSIMFKGTDLVGLKTEQRVQQGLGWIPENRRVFPNLTVRENLRMGSMRARTDSITLTDMYDLFPRLEEREDQLGGTLSGGEQQMLSIARALLTDPDLLLVDEPFEGLMPSLVDETERVLRDLGREEHAILLVEQNVQKTLGIADEGYILANGEIVHRERADSLLTEEQLLKRHVGIKR